MTVIHTTGDSHTKGWEREEAETERQRDRETERERKKAARWRYLAYYAGVSCDPPQGDYIRADD